MRVPAVPSMVLDKFIMTCKHHYSIRLFKFGFIFYKKITGYIMAPGKVL